MRSSEIDRLQKRLEEFFLRVDKATISNRIELGGYQGLDFHLQLLGKLARYIQKVLFDDLNWHFISSRHKIQLVMTQLHRETYATPNFSQEMPQLNVGVYLGTDSCFDTPIPVLLGAKFNNQQNLLILVGRSFDPAEVEYLNAWFRLDMSLHFPADLLTPNFPADSLIPNLPGQFPAGLIEESIENLPFQSPLYSLPKETFLAPLKDICQTIFPNHVRNAPSSSFHVIGFLRTSRYIGRLRTIRPFEMKL